MPRKPRRQPTAQPRSKLFLVLAGRKSGQHRARHEKRAAQKLRRDLEDR